MRVRGWCPGLHDPMETGDGWLARVRPPLGRLSVAQALALDGLAQTCGNGIIEITSRGNLQVRGLSAATHGAFVDGVCAAGLGLRDPVRERRRRLVVAPFADEALVARLERALVETDLLDGLPAKFVFRVDDGPVSIAAMGADVVVTAGMAAREVIAAGLAGGCKVAGSGDLGPAGRVAGIDAVSVAPRFGVFGAGELGALARRTGGAALRVTPFRSVIVAGVDDEFADGLGMIADPADPWLRVAACAGAPRCSSGVGPARDVAWRYLDLLPANGVLHVSGCEKGCAYRGDAVLVIPGAGL